jgi:ureidoglycolate lyase
MPQGQGICMRPGCRHATRVAGVAGAAAAEVTCVMLTRRSTTAHFVRHLATGAAAAESAVASIPAHRLAS